MSFAPEVVTYGGEDIRSACLLGDLPLVVLLWGMARSSPNNNIDLWNPDEYGNSLFHFAAISTNGLQVLHFLLQQSNNTSNNNVMNIYINARNSAGETPFMRAAAVGSIVNCAFFINTGHIHSNEPADNGCTALMYANRLGHLWTCHYIACTLTPDELVVSDNDGKNALSHACSSSHYALVRYFLYYKEKSLVLRLLHAQDKQVKTIPLH